MATERGFSLIETLVAVLIGVLLVVFVGVLGGNLIRHRANSDSSSAATNIAQKVMELIMAERLEDRNPDATVCAACSSGSTWPLSGGSTCSPLCSGFQYGPFSVNESLAQTIGGPYRLTWTVTDDQPWPLPDVASKRVVVEVTHDNNPTVQSRLATFLQASKVGATPPGDGDGDGDGDDGDGDGNGEEDG